MTAIVPRPALPGIRWWHKWIGVAVGLVLFGWTASGIVMLLPRTAVATGAGVADVALDLSTVTITPAQAAKTAAAARAGTSASAETRSVTLRTVLGTTVYAVIPTRGQPALVNAATGELFAITPARAESIATEGRPGPDVVNTERIDQPPTGYFGPMPAYRVAFGDAARTVAIVGAATGEMQRTQRRDRIMYSIGHNVHVFTALTQLPGGHTTRKGTMIMTALVAVLLILSGYWLSLPKRLFGRKRG